MEKAEAAQTVQEDLGKIFLLMFRSEQLRAMKKPGKKEVEILEDGQEVVWMKGGRGGLGNASFATPTNQAPEHAQPGEAGVEGWKVLELKVLADDRVW